MYYHLNMSPIQKKLLVRFYLFLSLSLFFLFTTVHILVCVSVQTRSISGALQSYVALILDRASLYLFSAFHIPLLTGSITTQQSTAKDYR